MIDDYQLKPPSKLGKVIRHLLVILAMLLVGKIVGGIVATILYAMSDPCGWFV